MKFFFTSTYGELLDLCCYIQNVEKNEVILNITDPDHKKIGEGIIEKRDHEWWKYMGQDYTFVFDGCEHGELVEYLRSKGEAVFGGTKESDDLENDRQLGQRLFKAAGFNQVFSKNFKSIDEAMQFVIKNNDKKYILKQNGSAPKSLNYKSHFEGNTDMIFHLEELKKGWNESEYGKIDFDLMEVVEGMEVAVSGFFNGKDWMRDKDGKIVGYINFEEKKSHTGGLGQMCGEMGTTFIGANEENELFREILLRPKIEEALRAINYRGVFDINCIQTDKGIVALEPTCRFGIPATSYEFIEGLNSSPSELLSSVARGENKPLDIYQGVGMVMVVAAKPFPLEEDVDSEATSIGERLWILKDGRPVKDFSDEQRKHIHLENFSKADDSDNGYAVYRVATKNGYLLTATIRGKSVSDAREELIKYIESNIFIADQFYRTDIGYRVEKDMGLTSDQKLQKELQDKISDLEKEKAGIKQWKEEVKQVLYGG